MQNTYAAFETEAHPSEGEHTSKDAGKYLFFLFSLLTPKYFCTLHKVERL